MPNLKYGENMSKVIARPNESIDSLLRRFKSAVDDAGILADARKREYYEKPSVRKKHKREAARKRALKREKIQSRHVKPKNVNFEWNYNRTEKIYRQPFKKTAQSGSSPGGYQGKNPNYKGKNYNPNYKGKNYNPNYKGRSKPEALAAPKPEPKKGFSNPPRLVITKSKPTG